MPRQSTSYQRACDRCGEPYLARPRYLRRGQGRFCSPQCSAVAKVKPAADRFWGKVRKEDGCWLWVGRITSWGYGHFVINGKDTYAHRFSWELHNGPIPDGLCVLHNCPGGDNPRCVRPSHLLLGTHAENMADRNSKSRQARGEAFPQHKLTSAAVCRIRARHARGEATQKELATKHGVSPSVVSRIVRGKKWRHVS